MWRNISLTVMTLIICLAVMAGCKKDSTTQTSDQPPVKTEAEYKAEADKEITEDNMEQELANLEQSIAEDTNEPL